MQHLSKSFLIGIFFLSVIEVTASTGVSTNKILLENFVKIETKDISFSDLIPKNIYESMSQENRNDFQKIKLGSSPEFGETRRFTNYALSEVIRHEAGARELFRRYSFSIPSEVSVVRKIKFQTEEVEREIRSWALRDCSDCEVRILNFKLPQNKNDKDLDWKIIYGDQVPRGFFSVPIELYKNEKIQKKIFAQGDLRFYRTVPVLRRALMPNLKIQSDDVEFKLRDVTFERNSIPKSEEIFGTEVVQYMAADQILWKQNLKRKVALQKGAPVSIVIKNSLWNIQAKGVAQENGYVGDLVRVQSLDNKKLITGTVLVDGTVEVK